MIHSPSDFSDKLFDWFQQNSRVLPWRLARNPYRVWIAEIMLQQTTVGFVTKRFDEWMSRFPTLKDLAESSEESVTRAWEGLGYYSRARNALETARIVVRDYEGELPGDYEALRSLPGIGPYTAAAIMAIAFDKPYPAVEANARRVLARVNGWKIGDEGIERKLKEFLREAIATRPAIMTEAVMELGQVVCLSRNPKCEVCPLASLCRAKATETFNYADKKKRVVSRRSEYAMVMRTEDGIVAVQNEKKLFRGLWLLPTAATKREVLAEARKIGGMNCANVTAVTFTKLEFKHNYTTNEVTLKPVEIVLNGIGKGDENGRRILTWRDLEMAAFPSAHRKIINKLLGEKSR